MAKRSKKYLEALKLVDRSKRYTLTEAVELAKKTSFVKFDATVEIAFRLNIDPRKAEQNLRGTVSLPHGTGKEVRVLVITKGEKVKQALDAGADYAGDTEYLDKIKGGWFEFDVVIATPDMMGELGKLGRILGPKGLMPNPKTGTVTMDVERVVKEFKAGKVEYRTDKVGNIQVPVGKVSFDTVNLEENIKAVYRQLMRVKPATVKGVYMRNVTISTSMGPGIKIASESME
ncbi:MAG TPA: 50S ribosomal protein L1 [Bacilli bacterium]|jgi:large subunit ribosomal protein L1|nr:50S ribosomal protein L1 [Acholeplasmataceae bacterium]OQB62357.1 MAG: 50S ribosomal protein L1 [Tenericutes bacterium ADurb.Bin140]HOE77499.1 50S ribosomal protein L1 [Bacilli bacterium]HON64472.1 50S ribosomal protein L1 [Bacilli bacterium]HOR95567.1 50S ribosomal protein L1 [Bacilli bacterium]